MNATTPLSTRVTPRFLGLLLGLSLWLGSSTLALAQTCDISATPSAPTAGQAFSLCGPSGSGFGYSWYDADGNPVGEERCLAYGSGLAAGTYDWTLIVSSASGMSICPYQLVIGDAPPPPPPACDATVEPAGTLCGGQSFMLCAPVGNGVSYAWYDQHSALISSERCVTLPLGRPPGTWNFSVVVTAGAQSSRCSLSVTVVDCARRLNCPRPVAFWARQCDQVRHKQRALTADQMNAIASSIDSRSGLFNWTSASSTGGPSLCEVLNPPRPMDARKQAKRQYAALLANVSAGEMGVSARNGEPISLDPNTSISCGSATTVAALITQSEQELVQLESRPLSDRAVAAAYRRIQECCERINRGVGIGTVCSATLQAETEGDEESVSASPNPFSNGTQIDYQVEDRGEAVDIGIYDVTGRLVQKLARGWQTAGTYQIRWDGRDASGVRARAGVFFVRGTIGDRPIAARLLLLR